MAWQKPVRELLEQHYTKEAIDAGAVDAAMAMSNMVITAQRAMADIPHGVDVATMVNDFLFGLPSNPFWQRHGGELIAIMRTSWSALVAAAEHAKAAEEKGLDQDAHRRQMMKMREVALVEMPVAVIACHPSPDMHQRMANLRVALLKLDEL